VGVMGAIKKALCHYLCTTAVTGSFATTTKKGKIRNMIKTCENPQCGKEFEPAKPHLQKHQKYCKACSALTPHRRTLVGLTKLRRCKNPKCDIEFVPKYNEKRQQLYHSGYCRESHRRDMSLKNGAKNIKKEIPLVEAICPKCRQRHMVHVRWIGSSTPWIFCHTCDEYRCSERFSGRMCGYNQSCTV